MPGSVVSISSLRPLAGSKTLAAGTSAVEFGRLSTKLWSYPRPNVICWLLASRIRAPIASGLVKSNGVPATGSIAPVGIRVESTGV